MAISSVDVQTDINNTQKNILDLDNQINAFNYKIKNIEAKIIELENERNIMNDSYQVIADLQGSLISDIKSLEPSSVCIQEIQSTVPSEINSKCTSALKTAEMVILKIEMQIKNARKEADSYIDQVTSCQQQQENCRSTLNDLNTEFTQAQEEEATAAACGM